MLIKYFKAIKRTNRLRENQKVWIRHEGANYLMIYFKWRGNGRYVEGMIDRFAKAVGEIREIDVDESFYNKIKGRML